MPFMLKLEGGPAGGIRYCDRLEDYGLSWPLPDELPEIPGHTGRYVKISESKLPPEAANQPNVGIGAVFAWREDD